MSSNDSLKEHVHQLLTPGRPLRVPDIEAALFAVIDALGTTSDRPHEPKSSRRTKRTVTNSTVEGTGGGDQHGSTTT